MEFINNVLGAPQPVGPYSQAVRAGELIFCAGQIGLDPQTLKLVPGGVEEQTSQVLQNIEAVLKSCGSSKERMVMATIFLTNSSDGPIVNELYGSFVVSDCAPARQTVVVKELPLGALIEISVIAVAR